MHSIGTATITNPKSKWCGYEFAVLKEGPVTLGLPGSRKYLVEYPGGKRSYWLRKDSFHFEPHPHNPHSPQ